MDSGSGEKLLQQQKRINEQRTQRKRRHSYCAEYSLCCASVPDNCSATNYTPASKYRGIDASEKFCLTDFPDEVLYEIFKNLDSWTYYVLMNCCNRFCTLLMDRRFWHHVDLSQKLLPLGILEDVLERTHSGTFCIKLRGPSRQYTSTEIQQFNKTLFETFAMRSTLLTVLELRGVTIDFRSVRIVHFPAALKRLVFRDCNICKPRDEQTIFCGIHTHLLCLEELGIEFSGWFEPYYIMMISKIPSLRWLSLKGCPRLGDFVPYGSMAARFGFKRLEYLDLRFTPITDSDLQCFNVVLTLKELLLDCPLSMRDNDAKSGSSIKWEGNEGEANDCQPSTSKASTSMVESDTTFKSSFALSTSTNATSQEGREETGFQQPSCSSPRLSSSSSSSSSPSSSAMNSPFASPSRLISDLPADDNLPEPGGNIPSRSRFLPRPDQLILLDFVKRRPSIRHVRPPPNLDSHFDQMMQHPLFWNIINPLGRGNEPNWYSSSAGPIPHFSHHPCCRQYPISDRGICCFGRPQNPVDPGVIWIRIGNRPSENSFERLSVRNYKKVTDISLHHLVQCSPQLIYLDLSDTSVTREGVQRFKSGKPECHIIADHLLGDDCPDEDPRPKLL